MSLFSYISFPREVDASCLQRKFDKSKAFTVAEIRGTELEKQFKGNLDELPDNLNVYFGDFFTDFQGISVYDNRNATFTDVFANKFIYSYQATFQLLDAEKYIKDCVQFFDEDDSDMSKTEFMDFLYSVIKNNNDDVTICRKQLCELIQINTNPNEIIELYSEFVDHVNYNLGPAKEKIILDLDQVLTSELLQMEDRVKIEIRHV